MITFQNITTLQLTYNGTCYLSGITGQGEIYAEEIDIEEDCYMRHKLRLDGRLVASSEALPLPDNLISPEPIQRPHRLDFSGSRWRGMRSTDHITDTISPLSIAAKMALTEHFQLAIPPPALIGLAASYVLAQATLPTAGYRLICRRLHLTYGLPDIRYDTDNFPYDYDTLTLYVLQNYNGADDPLETELPQVQISQPNTSLHQPMDCIISQQHLIIADGGGARQNNRIHICGMGD